MNREAIIRAHNSQLLLKQAIKEEGVPKKEMGGRK